MTTKLTITVPNWLDQLCAWPAIMYRQWKFGYTFRKISLGEGKFTIVDPQDFYRFSFFNWCPKENGPRTYAVRLVSAPHNRTKILSLHREIMKAPPTLLVDHKNGNGLDNRLDNLRLATHSQNQCNKGKSRSNSSSRFIGVYFEKRSSKWVAKIVTNGKRIWLGRFSDEISAAKAHDKAALKYHKEFAHLNFS